MRKAGKDLKRYSFDILLLLRCLFQLGIILFCLSGLKIILSTFQFILGRSKHLADNENGEKEIWQQKVFV